MAPNLIQRMAAPLFASMGFAPAARDAGDDRWWGDVVVNTLAGQAVTAETALALDIPSAVLERLGGTVSTLPLQIFERTGEDTRRVAREHPLYKVLHRQPNRRQTSQEYRDDQQRHLASWRNAYAEIVSGEQVVDALDPIHPRRMQRIERGADGWVYYTFLTPDGRHTRTLREDAMWHIRKAPLSRDGLRGLAVWETNREVFGRAQAVEQFGALYFSNGGAGGGVLEHPGSFKSKEDRDAFLEAWRMGGAGLNRHKDRLLLQGVKYSPFTVKNDEAQFLETLKEVGLKLCRLWNMPPHMVGMLDRATFSNIEQQSIEYVTLTLAPWIVAWEQAAHRDLLVGDDQDRFFVEFNVAGLLRGDLRSRWAAYAQGRQWGWLSINDVRRLENMEPIGPEGDDHLTPTNMVPAGTVPAPAFDDPQQAPKPKDKADAA